MSGILEEFTVTPPATADELLLRCRTCGWSTTFQVTFTADVRLDLLIAAASAHRKVCEKRQ